MVEVISTSNNDDLSAFLTAAYITHTYKVESTRSIVDIWENFRKNTKVDNNLDYLSVLLAIGRLMDLKEELDGDKFYTRLNDLKSTITQDLEKRGHLADLHDSNFITAMISSACIAKTDEIETLNEILDSWEKINNEFVIKTDVDKLAGVLTIGRIMENKYNIDNLNQIIGVFERLKENIINILNDSKVEQKHIAAAFLTNAYIEITPKVEKIHDMINLWNEIQKELEIKDKVDYITAILTYGRVRDLDAQYFLTDSTIKDIKQNLRKFIELKK